MSIRIRIILLGLVTVIALAAAVTARYLSMAAEIDALQATERRVERARLTSTLIHLLQQERGLSAGYLVDLNPQHFARLSRQRKLTDGFLGVITADQTASLLPENWIADFGNGLPRLRDKVDSGSASWQEASDFYTTAIGFALDRVAIEILSGAHTSHLRAFTAIKALAQARENLGIIRATVNGIYTRGEPLPADIETLQSRYRLASEFLRMFFRETAYENRTDYQKWVTSSTYQAVIDQIEGMIAVQQVPSRGAYPALWWEQATQLINTLKSIEDHAYDSMLRRLAREQADRKAALKRYIAGALGLTAAAIFITTITVLRILQALSILLATLGRVVNTQDFHLRIRCRTPNDEFGRISTSVNNLLDMTDEIIREKDFLANTDLLTGAMNHRSFLDQAEHALDEAQRDGRSLTLILCNIDHFRKVVEKYGHYTGDKILKQFSELLRKRSSEASLLGRWGGGEFVLLVPDLTLESGQALAEQLRMAVRGASFHRVGSMTCSFGVAQSQSDEAFDEWYRRVDEALGEAKRAGRDRVIAG